MSETPGSRRTFLKRIALTVITLGGALTGLYGYFSISNYLEPQKIGMPEAQQTGTMSVEEAIGRRRSVRDYEQRGISLQNLSQLLWAAQGITEPVNGLRAAPSAGGIYPLEIYIVVKSGGVADLANGVYHYNPKDNSLSQVRAGEFAPQLQAASLNQPPIGLAAVNIVIAAAFGRTTSKYGDRGVQYVFQESGHAAENIYLQSMALGLGTVVIGAFDDDGVRQVIGAPADEKPVYVQPVGIPIS